MRGGGREWLWHRDEPRRAHVIPGDAFADAGGLEECVPTVRGVPDHGDAWSRAWTVADDAELAHVVRCAHFELTRSIDVRTGAVVAEYRLAAEPGFRFVWAGHALLDLSEHALLQVASQRDDAPVPEAAPYLRRPWPDGADWIEGDWPAPAGLRLDTLGPDDGSAVGAVIYGAGAAATAVVHDGPDRLRMTVEADGQPASVALWRNLGGFPRRRPVPQHRRGTDAGARLRPRAGRRRRLRRHPGRRRGALAADDHRVPTGRKEPTTVDLPALLRERRLLAIVRGRRGESVLETVLTLAREGVGLIEVSLTSDKALDVIAAARAELGPEAVIGAGTVVTAQDARDAHAAGAEFIVTPGLGAGVSEARGLGLPAIVGALTPSEVIAAQAAGADAVKLFPASALGGPEYLRALRAPFPDVPFVPVGGVDAQSARRYLELGAVAVGVGSPLIGDAADGGDTDALRDRIRAFLSIAEGGGR